MLILAAFFGTNPLAAQEEADSDEAEDIEDSGLPGEHFSLEGAIDLFQKADNIEAFEKALNEENNPVNNLDLNEDGKVDYIRVVDNMDGDAHAFVLQVPVSETETQDIAVIELEKDGPESALLQIVGDEDIYGQQMIAEPFDEKEQDDDGKHGPAISNGPVRIVVNVWGWPAVRFVYRPAYTPWVSPWRWAAYPRWWRPYPLRPLGVFRVGVRPFHRHCHVVTTHRVVRAHNVYAPHRKTSVTVTKKTTVVRGKHGHVKGVKTTKTKTVKHRNGKVTKTKTTKARGRRRG